MKKNRHANEACLFFYGSFEVESGNLFIIHHETFSRMKRIYSYTHKSVETRQYVPSFAIMMEQSMRNERLL
jgi:hypothetical protein